MFRNARERAEFGCTTTWENSDGESRSFESVGAPRGALRDQIVRALRWDPTAKLVSYSTPDTVQVDVSGVRSNGKRLGRYWVQTLCPEAGVISHVGRLDLCHPRLRGEKRR